MKCYKESYLFICLSIILSYIYIVKLRSFYKYIFELFDFVFVIFMHLNKYSSRTSSFAINIF